jgi:hypothetical protein
VRQLSYRKSGPHLVVPGVYELTYSYWEAPTFWYWDMGLFINGDTPTMDGL